MLRTLAAVIFGMIVCQAVFSALAVATILVWSDYATHGHHWLDHRIFTFTSVMACLNLVFWALAFIGAGWAAAHIARDNRAVWILAGLMELDAMFVHLFREWASFPWWYNLIVVLSVVPATSSGALGASASKGLAVRRRGLVT